MTVLNLQITQSADDGSESGAGAMSTNAAANTVTSANAWYAFVFQNVTIPQGATINTAVLQIYLTATAADSPAFNIHAQAADTAASLTTTASDISSRPRTTANTNWVAVDLGVGYASSPDFAAAVQEVIDRGGWVSGNALAIILDCQTGVNTSIRMIDAGLSQHALLDIDYTAFAVVTGAAALSGSGSLAASGLVIVKATSALSGIGALSGSGLVIVRATATLPGSGQLTSQGLVIAKGAAALSGTGDLSAQGLVIVRASAVLSGSGTLTAAGDVVGLIVQGAAALSGSGGLAVQGLVIVRASAALSGSGALSLTIVAAAVFATGSVSGPGGVGVATGPGMAGSVLS